MLALLCPLLALLAAAGLCVVAPRRTRLLHLAPVSATTVGIIALASLGMALIR